MSAEDDYVLIGATPAGELVYASSSLIAQVGVERLREELVDALYLRKGLSAPGYHKVRTSPLSDDYVLVRAKTPEEALAKYLRGRPKR